MIYELKTYRATEGNIGALKKRFGEKTIPIFSRLGIEVTHCWDNLEDPNTFNYLVRFSSREAEKSAWDAFARDEEWKLVKMESEKVSGPLLASQSTLYLSSTNFSQND
ncbi:NIPSNAP family protein [Polynucleobacter sp. es-GGE-1]|uniref:NIPSNAP family protein n=1 Tax=Polynucleobacter sp. es-GGE-1 TaxID=1819724 RepID=UPI001C0E0CEF|nr:NIPSNAP family protein [Polynucleobacter sp. es-GGE-1]MBU3636039.1 NIPSNAP family protein [Polynucleobacter sp. es-GGE-1]